MGQVGLYFKLWVEKVVELAQGKYFYTSIISFNGLYDPLTEVKVRMKSAVVE